MAEKVIAPSYPDAAAGKPRTQVSSFKKWLVSLGPGIITAAMVFGPSKMTIASKLGAEYGYSMLWLVVIAIFFMIVFTAMSARIGLATQQSLLTSIRMKWGRVVAIITGIGIFLVAASFQAGNSIGVGIAVSEAGGGSPVIWVIVFNAVGISLLFLKSFYKVLERLMLCLVGLMLLAFVMTLFFAQPSLPRIAAGIVPSFPAGSLTLSIAFTASCFSIVGAFYQSYLVQERKRSNPQAEVKSSNSFTGMFILGLLSAIVMICAAAVLNPKGIKVNSASDMARALEPLLGSHASSIFLTGLFCASFSTLIGNATLGGSLLGDALGYGSRLNSKVVRSLIALVMVTGAVIAVKFGKVPLEFIVFAQSITIFLVPFIGIAMFAIANDPKIMGEHRNSLTVKILGGLGILLLAGLAISNLKGLL